MNFEESEAALESEFDKTKALVSRLGIDAVEAEIRADMDMKANLSAEWLELQNRKRAEWNRAKEHRVAALEPGFWEAYYGEASR